jgi:hypothetical protein
MFKPQKHLRLEPLNRLPKLDELAKAFDHAKSAKGCLVELPWRSSKTGKNYSLAVRIELGQTDPVWTLIEGEGSSSRAAWSVPFQDMDLLNDVLLLSLPQEFDNPAKTMQNAPAVRGAGVAQPSDFPTPTITRVTSASANARPPAAPQETSSAAHAPPAISAVAPSQAPAIAPLRNDLSASAAGQPAVPGVHQGGPAAPPQALAVGQTPVAPNTPPLSQRQSHTQATAPSSPATQAPGPATSPAATQAPGPAKPPPATQAPGPAKPPPATQAPGPAKPLPTTQTPAASQPATASPQLMPPASPAPFPASAPYPTALPSAYPAQNHLPSAQSRGYFPAPPSTPYGQPYPYPYPIDPATQKPYANYTPSAGPETLPLAGSLAVQPNMPPGAMLGIAPPSVPDVPVIEYEIPKRRPGIQLGKLLLEASLIPQHTLDAALLLQDMVKSGALDTTQAADALARAHNRSGAFETKIFLAKPNPNARFLNISVPPLGQILIEAGLINADTLKAALNLQEETRSGAISIEEAIGTFVRDCFGKARPETNKDQPEVERAINLLRYAGMLEPQDMDAATDVRAKHGGELLNILVSAGKLDEVTLEAAIQCQYFVNQNRLKVEQSVILLHFCQRSRITLDEAIEELGFERP